MNKSEIIYFLDNYLFFNCDRDYRIIPYRQTTVCGMHMCNNLANSRLSKHVLEKLSLCLASGTRCSNIRSATNLGVIKYYVLIRGT